MPSHTDKHPETPIHVAGNNQADVLAGEAAKIAQLHINIANKHKSNIKLVLRIQKRLLTIFCSLPTRKTFPNKPKQPPKESL